MFVNEIICYFLLVIFLACNENNELNRGIYHETKGNPENLSENVYVLNIISEGHFKASLSRKINSSDKKRDILNFLSGDTMGIKWYFKISTNDNWTMDTSFYIKNLSGFKRKLNFVFNKMPQVAPKNCNFEFKFNKFQPISSIPGNQIDTSKLNSQVISYIANKQKELVISYLSSYKKPKYSLGDPKVQEGLKSLKKCLSSVITIKFNTAELSLSKADFAPWLTLDTNMNADILKSEGLKFVRSIAEKYDVTEKSISFKTTSGNQISLQSELGTRIDVYRELSRLKQDILSGQKVDRVPIYGMKGIPNGAFDSNKNYVEVSISDQKMWFYKDGQLITESVIVTGCPRRGHSTPRGAFYVKYKAHNVILNGPGYRTRVNWWMPFNKGVGLHDARWREKFGDKIYLADGSHGCVNLPPSTAKFIYQYIQPGSIVLCY